MRACSSAGGGLRIAVVGNEELVTAEAGRRVALSSGGKVVAVAARGGAGGDQEPPPLGPLLADARPDLVLLTGGTDGGDTGVLVQAAHDLAASGWRGPVVVAGNADAAAEASGALGDLPHSTAPNVVPRIGVLAPEGARAAIREAFLAHVIGGKGLSARADLTTLVRGATPDVVLTGVEVLAAHVHATRGGDLAVVDVGGATTDVYSATRVDPEQDGLAGEVVAPTGLTRTVEGDLGMRWSAPSTVATAGLDDLLDAAAARALDPAWLPADETDGDVDEAIARAAATHALRRHAGRARVVLGPDGRVVERTGTDLREVVLVVGSGGVLRHGPAGVADRVLGAATTDPDDEGWQLPERADVVVDTAYLLVALGLLADDHAGAARTLAGVLAPT